jgi:phosphatidylserine decarboxylase
MRIHPEGTPFIVASGLISALAYIINPHFGNLMLFLTFFIVYFFRNPKRVIPVEKNVIVSPADGIVIDIASDNPFDNSQDFIRVSIFLRVWDVHVNRIPLSGTIIEKSYKKGTFSHAETRKALNSNEHLILKIEGRVTYFVRQVAGMIARRIVCYSENGDTVKTGERYGIIKFGSRVDVYLPSNIDIKVQKGQTMIGGETVIAKIKE